MGVRTKFWKGAWWLFVNHQGHRKAKRVGDRDTAAKVAQAVRERIARGDFSLPTGNGAQTFKAYATEWLKTAERNLKASTIRFYTGHLEQHIYPALGTRLVASLRRADCRDLVAACRAKGLKIATVRGIARTLSRILSQAVEDEILPANPALRLGRYLRRGDEPKPEIRTLTREEAAHLLAVTKEHFPRWYAFFLCALRTGMRLGELRGLQWGDVDFHSRFLTIRRNLVQGIVTTPKSHQLRRVDMSQQLYTEILAWRRHERERWLKKGKPIPATVFTARRDGADLDDANVRKVFTRILAKAEMRHIRIHDLRHTFASLLIQNGESLAYVKDQMGHASIQITVDTYGHLVPGGNRAAVDRLDDEQPAQPPATQAQPEGESVETPVPASCCQEMVSRVGIEPTTRRLRVCCSAN